MIAIGRHGGGIDLQDIITGEAHSTLLPGGAGGTVGTGGTLRASCLAISKDGLFVACGTGLGWELFDSNRASHTAPLRHDERRLASVNAHVVALQREVVASAAAPPNAQDDAANQDTVANQALKQRLEQRLEAALHQAAELERGVRALRGKLHCAAAVVQQAEFPNSAATLSHATLHGTDTAGGCPVSGHRTPIVAMCFSADGARLATGGQDGRVIVWNACAGFPAHTVMLCPGGAGEVDNLVFLKDGVRLVPTAPIVTPGGLERTCCRAIVEVDTRAGK
ncbi:hypothetical protein T484DRAFT_1797613, partial [Baffinella frigidus]